MSSTKKITELILPITVIGGFLGAVQDILAPLSKFGIWAGFCLVALGVFLIVVPEASAPGRLIKRMSSHWKTPLVFSFFILGAITITASSFSTENVNKGGKGILADNISAFNVLQQEILALSKETNEIVKDTNKVVKDTNVVVKDTNSVTKDTNTVVKTTQEVVKSTQENVEVILKNTKMTATKKLAELSYRVGDQNDFFRAVDELEGHELIDTLNLFKDAQLKLSRKTRVYPDLFSENNDRNVLLLRMPKRANLIHSLVYLDYPIDKIITVLSIFEGSEKLITPVADWYAWQSINPNIGQSAYGHDVFHPQMIVGDGSSSADRSLISYSRKRANDETTERGGYALVHTAAAMGEINLLKALIKRGHSLNQTSESGYTPLALAIENEQLTTAHFILENSVDVSVNNYITLEIALIKMLDGYYPFEGAVMPASDNSPVFGDPKSNPYYALAKVIISKVKSKPSSVIRAVKLIYKDHVDAVKVKALEHNKYPGTYYDIQYKNRVTLGQQYIDALTSM
jgi:hypothetical protein